MIDSFDKQCQSDDTCIGLNSVFDNLDLYYSLLPYGKYKSRREELV